MHFAALISDVVMTQTLGDDVIYHTISSGDKAIKAMVSRQVSPVYAGEVHLSANQRQIDVALADVPGFTKGSQFTIEGIIYAVQDIVNNDGFFATAILK